MSYTDFSLDSLRRAFALTIRQHPLFAAATPLIAPAWLEETLEKGLPIALGSEKARSEFIIAPILLMLRCQSESHRDLLGPAPG